jgi:hypothetical protein
MISDTNVILQLDEGDSTVTVSGPNAAEAAHQIARAVNRDGTFDALVAMLSPISVELNDIRKNGAEEAERRLRRLVSTLDMIQHSVEAVEYDDAHAA